MITGTEGTEGTEPISGLYTTREYKQAVNRESGSEGSVGSVLRQLRETIPGVMLASELAERRASPHEENQNETDARDELGELGESWDFTCPPLLPSRDGLQIGHASEVSGCSAKSGGELCV